MAVKLYLETSEELTQASQAGEKVFLEYHNKQEEIENAKQFGSYDWEFTLKAYANLFPNNYKFFKII
jgi:cell fate (sporulation/competence/biofilm development) regulator YlbF (YheA/YmcA/DUF963 family)